MTVELWLTLGAVILLIVLSGFFSGSETALTAASRARMLQLEKIGDRRARLAGYLMQMRERLIGALLIGNNLVNILASALATAAFLQLFGEAGVAYATLVMTAVVVVFAEVLPKTLAIGNPDSFARGVAPVVRVVVAVFGPLASAILALIRYILSFAGVRVGADQAVLSGHEEIRGAIDLHHMEGGLVKDDRDRIGGVLDLAQLDVADVMVHRTKIISLNISEPVDQIVELVIASPYTRMPLWKEEPENIVGVLHAKEVLRALKANGGDANKINIGEIMKDPWFVPDTTSLPAQLNAFLKKKNHFALVVDEYGEVQGLVTLEDILEEIVGDISDEHDVDVRGVRIQTDGAIMVDGSVPIRDLNRALDWQLPDEEATTIAGLVIHEAKMIPDTGQTFTFHGVRFEVLRKQKNRITALRITGLSEPETLDPAKDPIPGM